MLNLVPRVISRSRCAGDGRGCTTASTTSASSGCIFAVDAACNEPLYCLVDSGLCGLLDQLRHDVHQPLKPARHGVFSGKNLNPHGVVFGYLVALVVVRSGGHKPCELGSVGPCVRLLQRLLHQLVPVIRLVPPKRGACAFCVLRVFAPRACGVDFEHTALLQNAAVLLTPDVHLQLDGKSLDAEDGYLNHCQEGNTDSRMDIAKQRVFVGFFIFELHVPALPTFKCASFRIIVLVLKAKPPDEINACQSHLELGVDNRLERATDDV
mmetsp:Transcript_17113/g.43658  ORF Transcript_17113/g.43658 Transcript_17113/m.43658 type:complete len:267 (+) Transcript_17113:949-1749(+)